MKTYQTVQTSTLHDFFMEKYLIQFTVAYHLSLLSEDKRTIIMFAFIFFLQKCTTLHFLYGTFP